MNEEIKVTVCCLAYNHKDYIKYAIEGFLMQKTNFKFEILIHDDASTDGTAEIVKAYSEKYPDKITAILQIENQYSKGIKIFSTYVLPLIKGKYIAFCEGDDFWTNCNKLQKQYDFLESHPDYIAVAHSAQVIREDGEPVKCDICKCKKNEYTYKEFDKGLLPGQTATIMCRNYHKMDNIDTKVNVGAYKAGDRVRGFLLVSYGRIHCFKEKMSNYRLVLTHGSSYSANYKPTFYSELPYYNGIYEYSKTHEISKQMKTTVERMYIWKLLKCYLLTRNREIKKDMQNVLESSHDKMGLYLYIIKHIFMFPLNKLKGSKFKRQMNAIRKGEIERAKNLQQ
jgi:glycosyltransferase involved in cell wall biosynthesis